jgi:16S rRNA (adenine1518-N6/adenine1519-N6)-dimethyltransferase
MTTIPPGAGRDRPNRLLTSPAVIRELLAAEGVRPRRSFGQNFLIDGNILRIITEAARIAHFDTVIEVGPGLGALTQALVEQAGRVYAIESDPRMVAMLARELGYAHNLVIVGADALACDVRGLWKDRPPEGVKMVSNLPYQIAATLLVSWLQAFDWLREYTVMVQREVADRIAADAGGKDYSSASVKIQYRATVSRVTNVSRNCFYPRPGVDSSVLHLVRRPEGVDRGVPAVDDECFFDRVVTAAFSQRRKKLLNSVGSGVAGLSGRRITMALAELGLAESTRAEELTPSEFARLSNILSRP